MTPVKQICLVVGCGMLLSLTGCFASQSEVEDLQAELHYAKTDIQELERKVANLEDSVESLQSKIKDLEMQILFRH